MLVLIFALAVRLVTGVVGAVAPRPPRFPALSMPDPVAGENFSRLTGMDNLAQQLDLQADSRLGQADFGAENRKSSLLFPVGREIGRGVVGFRSRFIRPRWRCWSRYRPRGPDAPHGSTASSS